ncbi:MAG: hypothetical protein GY825_04150 [Phycisphaeraceae bacterium]|nr:hypothetical protein [Phycisphaeraceae bacterium]
MTLEKIGDVPRGRLFVQDPSSFDDPAAKKKIETFASMACLVGAPEFVDFYLALRASGDLPFEAYVKTIKWVFVTSDYLYVDSDSPSPKGRLRHAAFSLLKTVPSPAFAESFEKYRSGAQDAKAFTDDLVRHESFGRFVASFSIQWLELSEIDASAPDRATFPARHAADLKADLVQAAAWHVQAPCPENRRG